MTYTIVPYHAPRPVRLHIAHVTAHEKVPETKKGDDGVLLLHRETVITQMRPCNPYSKERGEGCSCYMIATMAYF